MSLSEGGAFCVTPVYSPEEALENEMSKVSGMLESRQEEFGRVTYLNPAIRMSDTPCGVRFRAPYAGEHNKEILQALGYSEEEIEGFKAENVI